MEYEGILRQASKVRRAAQGQGLLELSLVEAVDRDEDHVGTSSGTPATRSGQAQCHEQGSEDDAQRHHPGAPGWRRLRAAG
jgi:hypothetical protein